MLFMPVMWKSKQVKTLKMMLAFCDFSVVGCLFLAQGFEWFSNLLARSGWWPRIWVGGHFSQNGNVMSLWNFLMIHLCFVKRQHAKVLRQRCSDGDSFFPLRWVELKYLMLLVMHWYTGVLIRRCTADKWFCLPGRSEGVRSIWFALLQLYIPIAGGFQQKI